MSSVNVKYLEVTPASGALGSSEEADFGLDVTMVFQDLSSQEWTADVWGQARRLVGEDSISVASWSTSDLARPDLLAEAVRSAAQTEVILVAVSGADELPLDLYVRGDVWLPRRSGRTGALMPLIGQPAETHHQTFSVLEYFEAVARKGGLEYFPQAHLLPPAWRGLFETGEIPQTHDASPDAASSRQQSVLVHRANILT